MKPNKNTVNKNLKLAMIDIQNTCLVESWPKKELGDYLINHFTSKVKLGTVDSAVLDRVIEILHEN